jgi:hypothetical protein
MPHTEDVERSKKKDESRECNTANDARIFNEEKGMMNT